MGGGAEWDPKDIDQVRAKLEELHTNAAEILELAADANPEWYVWGLVGAIPAVFYWQLAAEDVYEHLDMMGQALEGQIKLVDNANKNYQATEEGISKALNKIKGVLDSGVVG